MKRLLAAAGATALMVGSGVLLAAPAQASGVGAITYTPQGKTLSVTGTRSIGEDIVVTLTGPGFSATKPSSGLGTSPVTVSGVATRNGTYNATVTSNNAAPRNAVPFVLSVEPAAPSGVLASPGDVGVMTVSWNSNIEPDLTGYTVLEDGATIGSAGSSCGPCAVTVTGRVPGQHAYAVVATRSDGKGGSVSSTSGSRSAVVAAPPPPPTTEPPVTGPGTPTEPGTPTDPGASPGTSAGPTTAPPTDPDGDDDGDGTPNGEDDTPGTPSGAPTAGPGADPSATPTQKPGVITTTPRRGTTSFGGFSGFGTALSVPGLRLGTAPTLAGGTPVPDGTFDPELAYDSELRETTVAGSEGGSALPGPLGDAVDSEQLMRTLAAALILLLAGAHLRRWLSVSDRSAL